LKNLKSVVGNVAANWRLKRSRCALAFASTVKRIQRMIDILERCWRFHDHMRAEMSVRSDLGIDLGEDERLNRFRETLELIENFLIVYKDSETAGPPLFDFRGLESELFLESVARLTRGQSLRIT
jgi:hypothetical protein